jgi:drug/metabolite transporter (DMT)-like permease
LSPFQLFLTVLTVLAMSAGQILFKLAARKMLAGESWASQIMFNPYLWVALLVYLSATALWVALLRQIPLHIAYPFVALAFVLVPIMGHLILNEPLRWHSVLGALVIVLGVWIAVGLE